MYLIKDKKWAWCSVVGVFIAFGLIMSIELSYAIIFSDVIKFYDINVTSASSIHGLIFGLRFLLGPVVVVLINLFGCDYVTIFGGIIITFGFYLSSCIANFTWFMISYGVLGGCGLSLVFTSSIISLSENFKEKKSMAFGIASSGVPLTYITFPHIFAFLVNQYEFRSALMILSAISSNFIAVGLLFRKPTYLSINKIDIDEHENLLKIDNNVLERRTRQEILKILKDSCFNINPFRNHYFLIFAFGLFWYTCGVAPWTVFILDFTKSLKNISLNIAVLTLTLEGVSQFLSRFFSSFILDRKEIVKYRGILCSVCCAIVGFCCVLLVTVTPSIYFYLIICAVRGFSLGIIIPQIFVILGEICHPNLLSVSIGILNCLRGISGIVGSSFAGLVRDTFDSYFQTFLYMAFSHFLASILMSYPFIRKIIADGQ